MTRISAVPTTSQRRPGNDHKDPLPFQQLTRKEQVGVSLLSDYWWDHHLALGVCLSSQPLGAKSLITAFSFLITAHLPSRLASATILRACLSSITWAFVRFSSKKILEVREKSFLLARRAQSLLASERNLIKRTSPGPNQHLSTVMSLRPSWSQRKERPAARGSWEEGSSRTRRLS